MPGPTKITFAELRNIGVRGVLVYCADYRCSHSIAISADRWPDDLRLSDIEDRFTCSACGKRGADVRLIGKGSRSITRKSGRVDYNGYYRQGPATGIGFESRYPVRGFSFPF